MSITYQYVDPGPFPSGIRTGVPGGVDPSDPTDPDNWINAWDVLQSGVNAIQDSGVIYCRGTETLTSTLALDLVGERTYPSRIIGVSADGVNDGTRYELVASGVVDGILITGTYFHLENFEVHSATDAGLDFNNSVSTAYFCYFSNLYSHDNVGAGIDLYYYRGDIYFDRCRCSNNGDDGWRMLNQNTIGNAVYFNKCVANDNFDNGFEHYGAGLAFFKDCISHDNGDRGFNIIEGGSFYNCIAHHNDSHGLLIGTNADVCIIEGCRFTANGAGGTGYGLDTNDSPAFLRGNYFQDNTDGAIFDYYYDLGENVLSGTDINYGYVDPSGVETGFDNFNLRADATLRSVGVDLP